MSSFAVFLPAWRHWHVKPCFLYQPGVTFMLGFAFLTSLTSRACQDLLSLPAWRHWHVSRLCFLYQTGVTGMLSFAFFTSLTSRACQDLLSLPAWRDWHVKLCITTVVSLASNALFWCCVFACATLRVTGFMSQVC